MHSFNIDRVFQGGKDTAEKMYTIFYKNIMIF